jgi:ferricrocin synthase
MPNLREIATFLDSKEPSQKPLSKLSLPSDLYEEEKNRLCADFGVDPQSVRLRPCTALQVGLFSQFMRDSNLYVNYMAFSFKGKSAEAVWKRAISRVVAHHEILRTGFLNIDNEDILLAMVVYQSSDLFKKTEFRRAEDISEFDSITWTARSKREFQCDIRRPPWKMLVEEQTENCLLHLVIFHGIYDAQSLRLLLRDVGDALHDKTLNPGTSIDESLPYIIRQAPTELAEDSPSESPEFWGSQFSEGLLGENAATRFPDLSTLRTNFNQKDSKTLISSTTVSKLEAGCSGQGFTLAAAGQLALSEILSAYVGEAVITFGIVLSGRDVIPDGANLVFPCITTVPFPIRVGDNRNKMMKTIMKFNADVREHQFSSLTDISKWSGYPEERLFDTIFAYQKFPEVKYAVPTSQVAESAIDEVRLCCLKKLLAGTKHILVHPGL